MYRLEAYTIHSDIVSSWKLACIGDSLHCISSRGICDHFTLSSLTSNNLLQIAYAVRLFVKPCLRCRVFRVLLVMYYTSGTPQNIYTAILVDIVQEKQR